MRINTLFLATSILVFTPAFAPAAIELVAVDKATQKDCRLSFAVTIVPAPNGSGAHQITLVIPAKQVAQLTTTPNPSYTFQIREGRALPLNVPLALTPQPDGSLLAQMTLSPEMARKAWAVLHVSVNPVGSGTAFSIDLGSYLADPPPAEGKEPKTR